LRADALTPLPALDALDVPARLRRFDDDLDDEHLVELCRWADPDLAGPAADADEQPLTPEQVRTLLTG
jgi:hypothetical protein